MIIKVPLNQIKEYWEVIKYSAIQADAVADEHVGLYSLDLLYDLLNEKAQCLISFEDNRKINRVLIISFLVDEIRNKKTMFFRTLYSFHRGSSEQWQSESLNIYAYAKKLNCHDIQMTTSNPEIIQLAKRYGFSSESNNYRLIL